ncbi:FAD-dependent oxidoreductase [Oscillatoria sp. CS-180]|uniref:FAD-dependent oxidoreductase n=1 Tax=Oscillatoria sp. CS-180 TaxID=3021720 RepID=UPI00232F0823|nr:FAD-dependent oxidoreductase [Oscillatoria sp. CS-180]MDB9527462.1 FAD-dependent oxidoreductase [Oscillatoria sp. CS-180]
MPGLRRLGRVGVLLGTSIALVSPAFVELTAIAQESSQFLAALPRTPDEVVECDVLIVGGGLSGTAAAYQSLKAGHTVCLTELTDWVGGQISSQGTTALDESRRQRQLLFYSEGYRELRDRVMEKYGELNPGRCWVSASCFMPYDAHALLFDMLEDAADQGDGELKWFPSTVPKDLEFSADGRQITSVVSIQHSPASGAPPLNTEPLSATIADAYRYEDSARFDKTIIQFVPPADAPEGPTDWYVIEATETGELIAMSGVPYRLGLDPKTYLNPSSPVTDNDPYCTQGFTYTFAMEKTESPQPQLIPSYYLQYEPYFSWEQTRDYNAQDYYDYVFTYRRLYAADPERDERIAGVPRPRPGDISMQNWTWGNDYRPGNPEDNLIYTAEQLAERGQLDPGGWMGGLRQESLRRGEENALSFYYWFLIGATDSQLDDSLKEPTPNSRLLQGYDSPMGTAHGLSKFPYIREGRRIVGRPSFGYEDGFEINEVDFTWIDFSDPFYQNNLDPETYEALRIEVAGQGATSAVLNETPAEDIPQRRRARIYPDSIGIAQYAIDFHPCMLENPPEKPGNIERPGVRQAHGQAYPTQIPLRALIPQGVDNLLVTGKGLAMSTIAAAAYRVHSYEWSVGVGAAATADFALRNGILPYDLVDNLPTLDPLMYELRREIEASGNPTQFPGTSIFNEDWEDWRPW